MRLINPDWGPDPLNQLTDRSGRRRPMARYEIHDIFREMIRMELVHGELSPWRRRKLVRYAASLRLSAVEAGELVQEAVRANAAAGWGDPSDRGESKLRLAVAPAPTRHGRTAVKLLAALAAALLIKLILSALLTG